MNRDQGGECLTIQGIKCYLPPVPEPHLIQNSGKAQRDQKWERTPLPTFTVSQLEIWDGSEYAHDEVISWDEAYRQEHIKIFGTDPMDVDKAGRERKVPGVEPDYEYQMDAISDFRDQELNRVKNGHWVYINSKPVYLPGNYYLYLNYWPLADGHAEFRYTDLELFYFWESVKKSRNFLGMIYITLRGAGKSYISGCISYYEAVFNKKARTTVQSKNDNDVTDFFRDKILMPITTLPKFLIPINKHGVSDITKSDVFDCSPPDRRGMNMRAYQKIKDEAMFSKMQTSVSKETGADGGTWRLIVQEEVGKTDPSKIADVYSRLMVNRFTVFRANKKLGNIFASSTVEEMEAGGNECLKIWNESNQYSLNAAGMTNTGIVRFFRSALDATFFDEFGYPVVTTTDPALGEYLIYKYADPDKPETHDAYRNGAQKYHDIIRDGLKKDPKALISYKQKNPYNEKEAFWINIDKCIYNAALLTAASDILNTKSYVRIGNIEWKEKDKEAYFVDDPISGKWQVSFVNFDQNQVRINDDGKTFTPMAAHKRVMAVDPYSVMNLADENSGSMGAAAVYNRYDINIPVEYSDTIIADYLARPKDPFDFYEDMIAAAFWFGCPIFFETNKSNVIDYFRQRGYKWGYDTNPYDFIWERPKSTLTKDTEKVTDGMYQSRGTIEHYTNSTSVHINYHTFTGGLDGSGLLKLKHPRVITDWMTFNPLKTKLFDMGVAASMALVASERKGIETLPPIDLAGILPSWNNSGAQSVTN